MAIKIPIETFGFDTPAYLRENEFWHIKKNLHLNPFYQMEPSHETTFEKFQGKIIGSAVGLFVVGMLFNGDSDAGGALAAFMCLFGVMFVFKLLLDATNYQAAISVKKQYFAKMRTTIIDSEDYDVFMRKFYQMGR